MQDHDQGSSLIQTSDSSEDSLSGFSEEELLRYRNPDGTLSCSVTEILADNNFWETQSYDPYRIDPQHWDGRRKTSSLKF